MRKGVGSYTLRVRLGSRVRWESSTEAEPLSNRDQWLWDRSSAHCAAAGQ